MEPVNYDQPYTIQIVTKSRQGKDLQGRLTFTWDQIIQIEEAMYNDFNIVDVTGKAVIIMNTGTYWSLENYDEFITLWQGYKSYISTQRKMFYLPMN